jgi:hypothetical protein
VKRELQALVAAGRGAWGTDFHPALGDRLYVFDSAEVSFQICGRGLVYRADSENLEVRFADVESIRVSNLELLAQGKRTFASSGVASMSFWLTVGGAVRQITLPIDVYSPVSTTVARIINDRLFES